MTKTVVLFSIVLCFSLLGTGCNIDEGVCDCAIPPDRPTISAKATGTSTISVIITWHEFKGDNYIIRYLKVVGIESSSIFSPLSENTRTYVISNLIPDTEYSIYLHDISKDETYASSHARTFPLSSTPASSLFFDTNNPFRQ